MFLVVSSVEMWAAKLSCSSYKFGINSEQFGSRSWLRKK